MNIEIIAKALKELGHPTRLRLYQRIVKAGHAGIAVGNLQKQLNIPGSTLSHHLSGLISAELISQRREGRTLYCTAEYEQLQAVTHFLEGSAARMKINSLNPLLSAAIWHTEQYMTGAIILPFYLQ